MSAPSYSVVSNYLGNAVLQAYLTASGAWVALHTSDPTAAGNSGTEVSGGGYMRQSVSFGVPSSKTIVSTSGIVFSGMPAGTVTHWALWTAQFGGNMLFWAPMTTPLTVTASAQIPFAAGDIAVTL